jgi:predicted phage terminase large subunit-like protein
MSSDLLSSQWSDEDLLALVDGCNDEDALLASLCRDSFEEFVKTFWGYVPGAGAECIWNWHLSFICQELEIIAGRVFKNQPVEYNLLINISPGTSKSTLCSILFPAWTWTNMPHARHIIASHTDTLVLDLATKSRCVIESELYKKLYPYIELRKDQSTKGYFANTLGGDRISCTVGGKSPMGFHGHFLCLVENTAVVTDKGWKYIQDIVPGDMVMVRRTRDDSKPVFKKVLKAGKSRDESQIATAVFKSGDIVSGTLNHPVWVIGQGWVHLGCLNKGDRVLCCSQGAEFNEGDDSPWTEAVGGVIRHFDPPLPVYDIEVEDAHEFFANGILVHNSWDDPIDPQKAMSEVEIQNAADYAPNVLFTRKTNKDVSVFYGIMQRLHPNDPSGAMLRHVRDNPDEATPIRHICLPAELADNVNPPELREKYVNGLMDPVRLSQRILRPYRANAYSYAGQFMQSPVPLGGGMFKDSYFGKTVPAAPMDCTRIRFWDRASTADGGCYTAGVLLARDRNDNYYVEHVVHGQWEPTERNAKMRTTAIRDRAKYGPNHEPSIVVEAEGGSSGRDAWIGVVKALQGFHVREEKVTGAKDTRAEPWSTQLAAGTVYLVDDRTWDIGGYIEEHTMFRPVKGARLGKYKDQIDSSSGAFNILSKMKSRCEFRVISYG